MVTRSKGGVVVDPSSFQRSAGLTGGGTISWQLAPARFDGVPDGPAADAALMSAARALAGAVRGPRPVPPRPGTAAALMLADGVITADTSLREPLGRHPLATAVLTEALAALGRQGRLPGTGQCVESTLVSNRLYQVEQRWTAAGRPGDLRTFALAAFRGAAVTIRQIGNASGRPHGSRRPPCRACAIMLPALGIAVPQVACWDPVPLSPRVVVPTPGDMEFIETARREWLLGAAFRYDGSGVAGLARVAERLVAAGPGATAAVLVTWNAPGGGPYLLTAANRDGAVWWLDNPSREVSDSLYTSTVDGVWSVTLDADGKPPGSVPVPPLVEDPFDPVRPSAYDRARLGELRQLTDAYPAAAAEGRVASRFEIAALVDALGVRPGTAEANGRWATLPADVASALLSLTTPMPTAKSVATVLAADRTRLNPPQRAWQADFEERLADAFTSTLTGSGRRAGAPAAVAASLADRMHRLAVSGESAPASVPRLPAYAGQVIGLPPDRLAVLREADPALADLATATGVYIDLTGRPDLGPYAVTGFEPVRLDGDHPHDLSIDAGRAALRDEDRDRARAAFRAEHGTDPRVLSTHDFHYVGAYRPGEPRTMALVPDLIAAAVRAITPVRPPPAEPPKRPTPPPEEPPPAEAAGAGPAPAEPAPAEATRAEPAPAEAAGAGPAPKPVRAVASVPRRVPPGPVTGTTGTDPGPSVATGTATPGVAAGPAGGEAPSFAYYALADSAERPTGLLVVAMLPGGPLTRRWEAPGTRSTGSPNPVSRQRAEEITRRALGFELPAEPTLPETLMGNP